MDFFLILNNIKSFVLDSWMVFSIIIAIYFFTVFIKYRNLEYRKNTRFKYVLKNSILAKLFFLRIIFHNIFIKNNFINLILSIITYILYRNESMLFGPFFSSILTFNLINGYSYYRRNRSFNEINSIILHDINFFIFHYFRFLLYENIPVKENLTDERKKIDMENGNYAEFKNYETLDMYEKYFIKICKNENLVYDEELMKKYKEYLIGYKDKINNNIIMLSIIFPENHKLISILNKIKQSIEKSIELETGGSHFNKYCFLKYTVYLIRELKIYVKIDLRYIL